MYCGIAVADTPLMKILDIYSNKIDNLNKDQHLFYSTELAVASKDIKKFPDNFKNKIITINPLVRESIYKLNLSNRINDKFTLLVVGGSQGANIFDGNLKNTIVNISKKASIRIIQQTSENNVSFLKDFYSKNNIENMIFCFDQNFAKYIQQADLCITRAGASALAELSVLNIPFIAVPLPSSKDNHQLENQDLTR